MERKEFSDLKKDVAKITKVIIAVDDVTDLNSPGGKKITLPEWGKVGTASIPLVSVPLKYLRRDEPLKLTADEKVELMRHIEIEFTLRNKAAEQLVEKSLNVIYSIIDWFGSWKMVKENPE